MIILHTSKKMSSTRILFTSIVILLPLFFTLHAVAQPDCNQACSLSGGPALCGTTCTFQQNGLLRTSFCGSAQFPLCTPPPTPTPSHPGSIATLINGQTPTTFYFAVGGQVFDSWCTTSGCTWDAPSGDASRNPNGNGQTPTATPSSPLNAIATSSGLVAYFLTSGGHVISLNTSLGFSDTWRDITAAGGNFAAAAGSPLVTVLNSQTPVSYFLIGGGQVISNWCTPSGCTWDAPSGDASGNPNGNGQTPAAAPSSPLNVVQTSNGLIAYFLTSSGHVISLNTSLGFSDTWRDITAAGGNFSAAAGSPLVTVLNGQTPVSYFLIGGGQVISNWCTPSGCTWDAPSGDASGNPTGTGPTPAAAPSSPLNVVQTSNGLIAYFLTPSGHVISLNTSLGFSDTWRDITAASGAVPAASGSPLSTVVMVNGNVVTHFVIPVGHVYSIACTTSGQCTPTDETASAGATGVQFF